MPRRPRKTAPPDEILAKLRTLVIDEDPKAVEAHRRFEETNDLEAFVAQARAILKERASRKSPPPQPKVAKPPPGLAAPPGLGPPRNKPEPPKQEEPPKEEGKKHYEPPRKHLRGRGRASFSAFGVLGRRRDGTVEVRPKSKIEVDWEKVSVGPEPDAAVGLFRVGAPTNDAVIVTKHARVAQSRGCVSRGRVPFFAPRSSGSFVFRLIDHSDPATKNVYATTGVFDVVVGGNDLHESLTQADAQLDDKNRRVPALVQIAHVAEHLRDDDARSGALSGFVKKAIGYLTVGPLTLAARRRAGEIPFAKEEEKSKTKAAEARKTRDAHLATKKLLDAVLSNELTLKMLNEDARRQAYSARERWCAVLEEFWPDLDTLAAHRDRGLSYRFVDDDASQGAAALDMAAKRALPALVPQKSFFELRETTRRRIEDLLRVVLDSKTLTLSVFGSSANLFGAEGADLDMCASVSLEHETPALQQRLASTSLIALVGKALGESPELFHELQVRDTARVPIVLFDDVQSGLDCDISTHNPLALRNTALLRAYASIDPRVRAVAYVVKAWAKVRKINSPTDGTLSSYGYILCVLHYLQSLRLLPSLQLLPPDWPAQDEVLPRKVCPHPFEADKTVDLYFHEPTAASLPALREASKRNPSSVGELIAGFFEYYAWRFDYRSHVVSIADPRHPVLKAHKAELECWPHHTRLSVADPFEVWYDVAHVLKHGKYQLIRLEFMRAHHILQTTYDANDTDILNRLCESPVEDPQLSHDPAGPEDASPPQDPPNDAP